MAKQDMNPPKSMQNTMNGVDNPDTQYGLTPDAKAAEKPKGGSKSSANFKNDPARAAEAGRKGGSMSGGNFKNNPARAAEAGRKGGEASGARRG